MLYLWRLLMNEATDGGGDGGEAGGAPAPAGEEAGGGALPAPAGPGLEQQLLESNTLRKSLEAEIRKLRAKAEGYERDIAPLRELDALLADDPLAALKRKGHHYNDLTARVMKSAEKDQTPEQREIAELKAKIAEREEREATQEQERQTAQARENKEKLIGAIATAIDGRTDVTYCAATGQAAKVHEELEQFVQDNGYVPTKEEQEEVLAKVEKRIREGVNRQVAELLKRSPEFKKYVLELLESGDGEPTEEPGQQEEPPADPAPPVPEPRSKTTPRTVTRSQRTAVAGRTPAGKKTHAERRAEALARLEAKQR